MTKSCGSCLHWANSDGVGTFFASDHTIGLCYAKGSDRFISENSYFCDLWFPSGSITSLRKIEDQLDDWLVKQYVDPSLAPLNILVEMTNIKECLIRMRRTLSGSLDENV